MTHSENVDVLIVGGGWTGISAAMRLFDHNQRHPDQAVSFLLLEGHADRLGGRAYSFGHEAPGTGRTFHFEHGAQYIGKEQTAIWEVVQDAIKKGLIDESDLVDGYAARFPYKEQVMMIAGRRYQYDRDRCLFGIGGVPPDLNLWDLVGALVLIQAIEAIEQSINVLQPWESPEWVRKLDALTLEEWISSFHLPPGAASLMRVSVEAVISVQANQVSAFYFFWYCACNGGFLNEVNDEKDGPQQYYLACGLDHLVAKLVEPFQERIQFGHTVTALQSTGDGVTVTTTSGRFSAKQVILAVTPASLKSIDLSPTPSPAWQALAAEKMGTTLKCQLFYKSPWWRNVPAQSDPKKEGVPQYTGYAGANDYPVIWIMDYSPVGPAPDYEDQGCYCLMTFTIGREAQALLGGHPSRTEIARYVTQGVSNLLNDARALCDSEEFLDIAFFSWDDETPLIPGGPNTVFGRGVLTGAAREALDEPILPNVRATCAELTRKPLDERTTALPIYLPSLSGGPGVYSDWRQSLGYMDGAILAGRSAAADVLVELGKTPAPIARAVLGHVEQLVADLIARLADWFVDPPPPPAERMSEQQVMTVLSSMADQLYQATVPQVARWTERRWPDDPAALQAWVSEVLVKALVAGGVLRPPPQPASDSILAKLEAFKEMIPWMFEFMNAASNFSGSGYELEQAFHPNRDPYGPRSVSDVVQLTAVVNGLMGLKSVEPFGDAATAKTPGRLVSTSQLLRQAGR